VSPIDEARNLVEHSQRIVFLTGAGISTDSGIPDFRGPNGLWTKNPKAEQTATLSYYLNDPEVRMIAWQGRLNAANWTAKPNRGHEAIVELEKRGQLTAIVTQNVDGLHQAAGNSPDRVIEVHGSIHKTVCWECGDKRPMLDVLERVRAGEVDPPCELCGGILKSDTISFGQNLVPEVIQSAIEAVNQSDLMIAVGSTLSVFPAASLVPQARQIGAPVIIVNGQETAMDDRANVLVRGLIGEVLPAIVGATG